MRLLILFSLWAPDKSDNSNRWLAYYRHILQYKFREDSKIIAVNSCEKAIYSDFFNKIDNAIEISKVAADMVINSDASGYQHALSRCGTLIDKYDAVCFFHTKGVSYEFDAHAGLRAELLASIFDRDKVVNALLRHRESIVALKGYMAPSSGAIEHFECLAKSARITESSIHYAATLTLYAVTSKILSDVLVRIPDRILTKNLIAAGENRYFFEGMFPSLLTAMGAKPVFLSGESFEDGANRNLSYEAFPSHCSAIVSREHRKALAKKSYYRNRPFPYVVGDPKHLEGMKIIFE